MTSLLILLAQKALTPEEQSLSQTVKWGTFFVVMLVIGLFAALRRKE